MSAGRSYGAVCEPRILWTQAATTPEPATTQTLNLNSSMLSPTYLKALWRNGCDKYFMIMRCTKHKSSRLNGLIVFAVQCNVFIMNEDCSPLLPIDWRLQQCFYLMRNIITFNVTFVICEPMMLYTGTVDDVLSLRNQMSYRFEICFLQ